MVLGFVPGKHIGSLGLVAQPGPVQEAYAAFPVAPYGISGDCSLDIVLPTGKIPHEIPPVHIIDLEVKEKHKIIPERRHSFSGRIHRPVP